MINEKYRGTYVFNKSAPKVDVKTIREKLSNLKE